MVATKLMTAEEFAALPDDGGRYELIQGVPVRMPPPGLEHGELGAELVFALKSYVDPRRLGLVLAEAGFLFERAPDLVRAPDVAFIRAERLPPREERRGYSAVLPDLAVEIVSPGDQPADVAAKVAFSLARGVPAVWVVWPAPRQVAVHRAGSPPLLLGGDVPAGDGTLTGFRLPLAALFR